MHSTATDTKAMRAKVSNSPRMDLLKICLHFLLIPGDAVVKKAEVLRKQGWGWGDN